MRRQSVQLFGQLSGQFSAARWRIRATLWAAALSAGLVVVLFAKLAEWALDLFFALSAQRPWLPFLLAPGLGMLVVWASRRYCAGSQGSGIPQVIAATRIAGAGGAVAHLVSLRIACGKVLLGALALCGGFSAGREGPSVQVAASILHASHRFLPNSRALRAKDLILAGGAAGIAAAFNTPLAGIVFAVEELGRKLETRTSGVLLSSIIMAGLVAIALQGNYNYFGHLKIEDMNRAIVLPVVLAGIACGLLGGLTSRLLLWPQQRPGNRLWRWRREHPVWFAGACGLCIALIGWASGGLSYGSGYLISTQAVSADTVLPWYAPLARLIATLISYYSGIPGGLFAPSLAVGAALGSNAAHLLGEHAQIVPCVALCMAGFLAAVTQSPITAAIIVMEMIDGHDMVISLMAVALIAKAISARIGPELYQQLALDFATRPSNVRPPQP
ncbi:chloride channel protein [Uliginosibacterium sediminicola]|uniref:Chloride channel protein n=1 Tax=Uliginosibacterium sediminicola TaxID=2024550 RepID=A0ABU9Z1D4_9RHOO